MYKTKVEAVLLCRMNWSNQINKYFLCVSKALGRIEGHTRCRPSSIFLQYLWSCQIIKSQIIIFLKAV